ncbi:MAG TPA: DUF4412 domain-containing protein [Bacteroidia bacterium]|jgi:hypothetical protein|nr:DUF4412 domain-containing protein [Bacteroidia bacterium]
MKKLYFLISITILSVSIASAQQKKAAAAKPAAGPFEGTIDFMQMNGADTSYYKYYVKGNNIKVDNPDHKTGNSEGVFLIDLSTKKMTALSPVRKIYFDQASGAPAKAGGPPKTTKTGATKKINGYTCNEYLVVDAEEGLKIHYWMAAGHFDFFTGMLTILNRKDKFSEYFLSMTGMTGMFPMMATEEDISGAKKGEMKASNIVKTSLTDDTFSIPAGYKEFKK